MFKKIGEIGHVKDENEKCKSTGGSGGVSVFIAVCLAGAVEREAFSESNMYIYPKKGQSEEQQSKDKYECYSWAVKQTGYDPSAPAPSEAQQGQEEGVRGPLRKRAEMGQEEQQEEAQQAQQQQKRSNYDRAYKTCLDGRGYEVN
jgi:hypothetical protein